MAQGREEWAACVTVAGSGRPVCWSSHRRRVQDEGAQSAAWRRGFCTDRASPTPALGSPTHPKEAEAEPGPPHPHSSCLSGAPLPHPDSERPGGSDAEEQACAWTRSATVGPVMHLLIKGLCAFLKSVLVSTV